MFVQPGGLFGCERHVGGFGVVDHRAKAILVVDRCQSLLKIQPHVIVALYQRYLNLRERLFQRDRPDLCQQSKVDPANEDEIGNGRQSSLHWNSAPFRSRSISIRCALLRSIRSRLLRYSL